jgi:hypothetical protein
MPLPNLTPDRQCEAITRNGNRAGLRCLNLKARGTRVCKNHGARKTAPKGELNPMYKTGKHVGYRQRCEKGRELRELLALGLEAKLFPEGTAIPGRPPKPRT